MENNYSNYDMLDKMVANNKKAKSWTAFWVIVLCLMAGAVLWLANTVAEKNKTISLKDQEIQATNLNLEAKSLIIDSLTANCNAAKTAIIKDYDSVITQTQEALNIVTNETASGSNTNITPVQQEKIKEANYSINKIQNELKIVKANIRKIPPRLFIQYNDPQAAARIEKMLHSIKKDNRFIIAPPEYVNSSFPTIIKFYNYNDRDQEKLLIEMVAQFFNIDAKDIRVKQETNEKIKNTIEIWIGTKDERQNVQQVQIPKS